MTVPATVRRAGPFLGTGSIPVLPFTFKVFTSADLIATKTAITGLETVLDLTSDYTVSLNVDQDATPGGTLTPTAALALGETITITSGLEYEQTLDLLGGGNFSSRAIEDAFDRTVIQIQQLAEQTNRSLRTSVSFTGDATLPAPEASQIIGWDSTAQALVNYTPADLATVVVSGTNYYDRFSGTGVATQFTLTANPGNVNALDLTVNSVPKANGADFSVSGTTLTFVAPPPTGTNNIGVRYTAALPVGTAAGQDVSFLQAGTGAVVRNVQDKLRDFVSVKDFGAIGTANPANEITDTAAFLAALASGRNVFVPEGTYYVSQTLVIAARQVLKGAGRGLTTIRYSGGGTGIRLGTAPGSGVTVVNFDSECSDLTLVCTNRGAGVNGVTVEDAVYFNVSRLYIIGSGSPNSAIPAERVLYGSGLRLTRNAIQGRISMVACKLWENGYYLLTEAAGQSYWTASLVFDGQGEVSNNTTGILIGDPTIGLGTAAGVSFRDIAIQGNYGSGITVSSGDHTIIDSCYFESNANYDVIIGGGVGNPNCVKVINCRMDSEDIGVTPYGNFPYLAKVLVLNGSFTTIRDNDCSIPTAIPLINVSSPAISTVITGNRLNSTAATTARITNASSTTITAENDPEAPTVAIGSFIRNLGTASGSVTISGLGFRPTSVDFFGAVNTGQERFYGSAGVGVGIQNICMATDNTGANTSHSECIRILRTNTSNMQTAVVSTFTNDGFTLAWTKTGSPPANDLVVNFIARR